MSTRGNGMLTKFHGNGTRTQPTGGLDRIFDNHAAPLHWPGTNAGYPYRGESVPDLKKDELDRLVQHVLDFHSFRFEMWQPEHEVAYQEVMDRVNNGWYCELRRHEEVVYLPAEFVAPTGQTLTREMPYQVIFLEWAQIYGQLPQNVKKS